MKKCFLFIGLALFIGVFVSSIGMAQQSMEDVVYLKNGSIIHGTIIEQVPSVSIKIKTRDGNIFVYKIEEVAKMTKEPTKERLEKEIEKSETETEKKVLGERLGKKGTYAEGLVTGKEMGPSFTWGGCLLGGLIGPFGYLFTSAFTPDIPNMFQDKSKEYQQGFRKGYKEKAKSSAVKSVTTGWLTLVGIVLISTLSTPGQ